MSKDSKKTYLSVLAASILTLSLTGCGRAVAVLNNDAAPVAEDEASFHVSTKEDIASIDELNNHLDEMEVEADSYYKENAYSYEKININDSNSVQSEKDIMDFLSDRGFTDEAVYTTYCYEIDGNFVNDTKIDPSSEALHPTYQMYYMPSDESFFTISIVNGQITASPVSYLIENYETLNAPIIFSESEDIYSYDSYTNAVYKTLPKEDVLEVKVIDRIDADALKKLAEEGY